VRHQIVATTGLIQPPAHARIVELEGQGHMTNITAPELTARVLLGSSTTDGNAGLTECFDHLVIARAGPNVPRTEGAGAKVDCGEPGSLVGATLTLPTKGQAMQASDTRAPRPLVDPRTSAVSSARGILPARPASPVIGHFQNDAVLGATEEVLARGMGPRSDKGDGDPNQDPDPPMVTTPSDPIP
jgi:hypothetical protein